MKISKAFEGYIEYLKIKNVSKNAMIHARATGNSLVGVLGNKQLHNLTLDDVATWKKRIEYGRAQNTVRNYVIDLKSVLRFWRLRGEECMDSELVPSPKREPTIPEFLTAEEVKRMIDCSQVLRTRAIIALLYSSGIRLSEMLQLNRDSFKGRAFSVKGKGGKVRLCFIDDRAAMLITQYQMTRHDLNPALFVSRDKLRMTATNVQMAVKNAARAAGIDRHVTPHTFRHSFATNYLSNNGNMRHLQVMLGHSNLATTAHYSHLIDGDLYRAYLAHHTN